MKLKHRVYEACLAAGQNEVSTTQGIIRGVKDGDIYMFRGIAYGKADRFKDALRLPLSGDITEAISYGAACPEFSSSIPDREYVNHPYYTIQSEDCLYLNIWSKNLDKNAKAPIVVFFADKDYQHSFTVESLEQKVKEVLDISNAVVFTVYTRLNVLGYLDLSRFGNEYCHSGNQGLKDRALALDWIKENAMAFGGNPDNLHIRLNDDANPLITIERTAESSGRMTDLLLQHLGLYNCANALDVLTKISYEDLAEAAVYAQRTLSEEIGYPLSFSPVHSPVLCPGHPIASTPDGRLRGAKRDSTYIFRGIRYAKARRFHMPTAPDPWEGIKDALVYGPVCPEIETVNPDDNYTVPHVFYPQEENCQYLNIWTQSLSQDAKKPVLVWFHGGGFATGSGIEHFAYNGKAMSEKEDVVVVTLNHRLNVLGYLDLSAYGAEYKYSGNVGNADLVEALIWIKRNIASFGGDPENVTIFGQSGGGGKVASLLQTPSADGLFHKAVIQSGLADFPHSRTNDNIAQKILEKLGISEGNVALLEDVPYHKLASAVRSIDPRAGFSFGPVRDDDFYLGDALEVGICEHARNIPVMVGNVLGEFCQNFVYTTDELPAPFEGKNKWSYEKTLQKVQKAYGKNADTALALQKDAYPHHPLSNVLFTDYMFRPSTFDYLKMRAKNGLNNTYGYMFSLEMPPYGGILPWHNAEIPYVFHTADAIEPSFIPDITDNLEDIMCHCWCNFARTGSPDFPCYDEENRSIMYFDQKCEVRDSFAEEKLVRFIKHNPPKLTKVTREQAPLSFGGGPRIRHF